MCASLFSQDWVFVKSPIIKPITKAIKMVIAQRKIDRVFPEWLEVLKHFSVWLLKFESFSSAREYCVLFPCLLLPFAILKTPQRNAVCSGVQRCPQLGTWSINSEDRYLLEIAVSSSGRARYESVDSPLQSDTVMSMRYHFQLCLRVGFVRSCSSVESHYSPNVSFFGCHHFSIFVLMHVRWLMNWCFSIWYFCQYESYN